MVARLVEGAPACVVLRVGVRSLPVMIMIVVVRMVDGFAIFASGDCDHFLPEQLPHKVDVPFFGRLSVLQCHFIWF